MAIVVAEYLGVRTDKDHTIPVLRISKNNESARKPTIPCPFKNSHCDKAKRGDKPVCSIRDVNTNELWIVCSNRLCATHKGSAKNKITLTDHQQNILHMVAKEIFEPNIQRSDILVKREVKIPISLDSSYHADYIMWRKNPRVHMGIPLDKPVVLEMQGGGETTSTGDLTKLVSEWENNRALLTTPVNKVAPLVTNAWRRQQEQFLVKGNVAMQTGGRMVFCIGTMIYNYLMPRLLTTTKLPTLKNANWTLALLTFKEDTTTGEAIASSSAPNSIPLIIDDEKTLFTNYASFVQAITNQGAPCLEIFDEPYEQLS